MKKMSDSIDASNYIILLVDDNPANLSVVMDYLAGQGFQIMVARDGEAGLRLAQQDRPDLILLDVRLPGIDGFEVCRRLKADERTQEIPVIFMTVAAKMEDKVRGFEVGGVDYITKPFQQEEVLARVTAHLRLRELTRQLEETNESLERRVEERTAALSQANQELQAEIAERKRAEAALLYSEERLRLTMEAANIGSWDWDLKNDTWSASPIYYTMLGYEPHAGPADRDEWLKRVHPDDRALVAEKIHGVLARDFKEHRYEARLRHADGTYRWQYVHGFGIERDEKGRVTRMLGIRLDITEQKRAEEEIRRLNQELEQRVFKRTAQLETANKELEAFAYSVSHDLRAPLRHIDGFLELLQQRIDGTLDERSRHYMDTISSSAKYMGQLIDDLLAFSRMGRYELSKTQVDLGTLVHKVVQELEPETESRDVHWHIANLPTIEGDGAMLHLVLTNLIANALKFSRACVPAVIEIGCRADEKETIFFIRDNGVGFDMAYVDKLFGVFQRLHPADEFEGTGIGLANVRRIINRHGGRTWAEGKTDHGATFYFSLPHTGQEV
jgi:PAS domain S-box-containing protein